MLGEAEATSTWGWGQRHSLVMRRGLSWPGQPCSSELHGTHYRPRLIEGGDEDLLGGWDGDEAAHIRGRSGTAVLLFPGFIQRADVQEWVRGVAAQDCEGVGFAQAGWRQRGCGGGCWGRADVKRAPGRKCGPGRLCWVQDLLLRE